MFWGFVDMADEVITKDESDDICKNLFDNDKSVNKSI